jgi:hypothetical protein
MKVQDCFGQNSKQWLLSFIFEGSASCDVDRGPRRNRCACCCTSKAQGKRFEKLSLACAAQGGFAENLKLIVESKSLQLRPGPREENSAGHYSAICCACMLLHFY